MKLYFPSLAGLVTVLVLHGCSGSQTSAYRSAAPKGSPKPEVKPSTADAEPGVDAAKPVVSVTASPAPVKTPAQVINKAPEAVAPVKPNEPFQPCIISDANRSTQPITAKVYQLPAGTGSIANATLDQNNFRTKICMTKFDVPTRSFTDGFPNVPNLFEWFGLDARAKIVISTSGVHKFRVLSDDGAILQIGGQVVVNHDGQHSPSSKEGSVRLNAGTYDLKVLYFQGPATEIALQIFWTPPGKGEEIVPTSAFQAVSF